MQRLDLSGDNVLIREGGKAGFRSRQRSCRMLKGENGRFAVKHHEAAHDGTIQNAKALEMLDFSAPWTRLPNFLDENA